jgi:hypothetical protein
LTGAEACQQPKLCRIGPLIERQLRADDIAWETLELRSAIIGSEEVAAMKSRQGYKGYIIAARSYELQDGGFSAEFSVEEHEADGFMETEFYMPEIFPTQESAIEAALHAGRRKIDTGFERGSAVVNG